jgi:2'-5' RNA ligase
VEDDIRAAHGRIAERPGAWVPLADLRDELADRDRGEVDDALKKLAVQPGVQLIPWDNKNALGPRDRAAALRFGGEDNHALRFDPPEAVPKVVPQPLTSKVNAHSLTRGDMIVSGGKTWHVTGTRREGSTVLLTVVDAEGNEHTIARKLNEPLDRVTGGRSGGGGLTKAADPDTPHTGAMVALIPTVADAERLTVDGGEPGDELHLTLLYLGKAANISQGAQRRLVDALRSTVEDAIAPDYDLPVQADGFSVSIFNPGREDREPCIVLGVGGDDLQGIRNIVLDTVREVHDFNAGFNLPEQHTPWVPHLTLLYSDDADRVAELTDRTGPIAFDRLRIVFAGVATDIPLGAAGIS